MRRSPPPTPLEALPTTFQVGDHAVVVRVEQRRWSVSVDTAPLPNTFETQAEAWEAGVRESARLDDLRSA
jgi:hypothetical protein